ncbi:MAG: hypothetical protein AAFO81_07245 [Pseudomonadota bacterium]
MNYRYLLAAAATAALATFGQNALAQADAEDKSFSQLDQDSDLRVSAEEARADQDVLSQFGKLDANADGYLDRQEFAQIDRNDRDYQ